MLQRQEELCFEGAHAGRDLEELLLSNSVHGHWRPTMAFIVHVATSAERDI